MFLMRSITVGLLGACLYILIGIPGFRPAAAPAPAPPPYAAPQAVSVVDVAHGVPPSLLTSIVQLRHDERVIAVDDQAVANDLAAGAAIAARDPGPGRFLDLTVAGAAGSRRILVLMH